MSDICDDADGVRSLGEAGARFRGAFNKRRGTDGRERKPCRKCGVQPTRRSAGDGGMEIFVCPICGRQTPPLKSRQTLQAMWNDMN